MLVFKLNLYYEILVYIFMRVRVFDLNIGDPTNSCNHCKKYKIVLQQTFSSKNLS